jgi:hypothetical protein
MSILDDDMWVDFSTLALGDASPRKVLFWCGS